MAVVKIKDANGNWQNIVALKGDKGDTGERGPKGPAGTTSFAGLTDVPNRVKNAVSSVNGTAADANGNVAISVSSGPSNVSGATVTKSIAKKGSFTLPSNALVMFAVDSYLITTATINGYSVTTKSTKNVSDYFEGDSTSQRFYSGLLCIPLPKGAVIKNTNAGSAMTILYTPT